MRPLRVTLLSDLALPVLHVDEHECPYLPDREAAEVVVVGTSMDSALFGRLLEAGFRRSGDFVYRAACAACSECKSLRVPVGDFRMSRSQQRVWRRNQDVTVSLDAAASSDERFELFLRYQAAQHEGSMIERAEDFEDYLEASPIEMLTMEYRLGPQLIGVGVVDVTPAGLSSVYFYFDPQYARRSLGTFSALREIEECRRRGLAHWYAGYYIAPCDKMNYKARFRPFELRQRDGVWHRSAETVPEIAAAD